ncbi:uncharacterized protein LOC116296365 [Actinia tenebrosa]|uniref:Uncharacterized protein LOC116296365 n=1 Tax=Actinia tenebrosa TaxID=6105 RepID=A0A6P8I5I5_ACTTE|nr:uncharacterized protein LOC116296365 [Actinia tenebrosa]
MDSQMVNRILYIIIYISTAVFCRSSPSESTNNLTEKLERKKTGIRMMALILFIITCALVFICKNFGKSSQPQEFEVIRSVSSEESSEPSIIVVNSPYDDGHYENCPLQCNVKLDKQTSTDLIPAWEETSVPIKAKPIPQIILELDTRSLETQQVEQQEKQVTAEQFGRSTCPVQALTSKITKNQLLNSRSLQPQQVEQQAKRDIKPALGKSACSVEALPTCNRITRKKLLGKVVDIMRIGWSSKETSKIGI